jgi:nicotinic acid phosphoribosyltransferase
MSRNESALLTDLYQLTMLQAYFDEGMADTAVFEFFVRALPPGRNFLLAAGLEQVLCYLEQLRVTETELAGCATMEALASRFSLRWARCALAAMCTRCRRARCFSSTSRCCASPRRSRRRSWWRAGC